MFCGTVCAYLEENLSISRDWCLMSTLKQSFLAACVGLYAACSRNFTIRGLFVCYNLLCTCVERSLWLRRSNDAGGLQNRSYSNKRCFEVNAKGRTCQTIGAQRNCGNISIFREAWTHGRRSHLRAPLRTARREKSILTKDGGRPLGSCG
jgi:hypothetical protein